MIAKYLFLFAGLSGLVSVVMGAFGAHGLRGRIDDSLMHAFETGVTYQLGHSLALIGVCILMQLWDEKMALQVAGFGFTAGIILFSGSLYALALTGVKWFGPVTPVGGLALITGWAALTYAVWENV
jgi:uncharacterized membrane protein YgdD (TMEM256/DUF423 family)